MHIAKRGSSLVLPACLLAAMVTLVLAAAGGGPVARHVIGADGKRMTIQEGAKILFFDGIGAQAKQLAAVDITGRRATSSRHGTAVALCSQFIDKTGPVAVYDNTGRKLGQFDVQLPWKVTALSDDGKLIALTKVLSGLSPFVVRLCDLNGTVLAAYDEDPTYCTFTPDGLPLVWGAQLKTREPFLSVLNKQGLPTATWRYPDQERWIYQVAGSERTAVVAVLDGPKSEPADTLILWRPSADTRNTIALPKAIGKIQTDGIVISVDGSFVALRHGATGILLVSTAQPSVALSTDVSLIAGEENRVTKILDIVQVSNDGTVFASCLLESGRGIVLEIDATGKLTRSLTIGV